MKTLLVILALQSIAGACMTNQFEFCNTAMDYYVTENLMRLSDAARDAKEDTFLRDLKCWDEGDETKGLITCEDHGVNIAYNFERHDDYKPTSILLFVPAESVDETMKHFGEPK